MVQKQTVKLTQGTVFQPDTKIRRHHRKQQKCSRAKVLKREKPTKRNNKEQLWRSGKFEDHYCHLKQLGRKDILDTHKST